MTRFYRMAKLIFVTLLFVLALSACAQSQQEQSAKSTEAGFDPLEIRIYQNGTAPVAVIDGKEQKAKEITTAIEDLLKTNTESPGFVSLAVSEKTVAEYKANNDCVELVLKEPCSYPIYGAEDSRMVNLKMCLVLLNQKWLMYADADGSKNTGSSTGESNAEENAYMSGPLVLKDVTELSEIIKEHP